MVDTMIINIGKQFSRYPVGRYLSHGEANGERFREDILRPALTAYEKVEIEFDDALGYGSSFLEEAFGGLVRHGFSKTQLLERLVFTTEDESLREEVVGYIKEAAVSHE